MDTHPGEGVLKEEKFPNTRKPSHQQVCGEFWNLRRQRNQEENINKKNSQITHLMATLSGGVAHMLASATSKLGLNRKAQAPAALLRIRTRPECPEGNLRELM